MQRSFKCQLASSENQVRLSWTAKRKRQMGRKKKPIYPDLRELKMIVQIRFLADLITSVRFVAF